MKPTPRNPDLRTRRRAASRHRSCNSDSRVEASCSHVELTRADFAPGALGELTYARGDMTRAAPAGGAYARQSIQTTTGPNPEPSGVLTGGTAPKRTVRIVPSGCRHAGHPSSWNEPSASIQAMLSFTP
jgi:hypothetical protein